MEEDLGDLDVYRAHLLASPAKGRGEWKGVMDSGTKQLRRENRPDGARISGIIGVPTDPFINRTDIQASTASNAVEGLPPHLIRQNLRPPIVQEDQVELFRPVPGMHSGPEGGVGVHSFSRSRSREELEEHLQVLKRREDLLDSHEGDEDPGEGKTHSAVPFRFHHTNSSGVGEGKIRSGHGHFGRQELLTKVDPGSLGQSFRVVGKAPQPKVFPKEIPDLRPVLVDSRDQEMGRGLRGQLDDQFGQIGLSGFDPPCLQGPIQANLVRRDGLHLHDLGDPG
jgi:hypothetical protein